VAGSRFSDEGVIMQVKTRETGFRYQGGVRRLLIVAVAVSFASWGCGGSDSGPTDPPNNPPPPPPAGTSTFSGSWDTTNLDEVGTPSSRYVITQNGGALTGDAYWRWRGVLERIGPITGTIAADGSFEWTAVMNDNGWDGTETVTGKFTGSASSVSGFAMLSSAGPSIQWKWFAPDGSLREEGTTQIENPPTVIPTHGEGPLGGRLWRGAVLFASPGNCNSMGFAWTMGLAGNVDSEGDPWRISFDGGLSARRMTAEEAVNLSGAPATFLGPVEGTVVDGFAEETAGGANVGFSVTGGALSGDFGGGLLVALTNPAGDTTAFTMSGPFKLNQPGCIDEFGSHDNGLYSLTAGPRNP
jgi:hypothetical protein